VRDAPFARRRGYEGPVRTRPGRCARLICVAWREGERLALWALGHLASRGVGHVETTLSFKNAL